MQPKWIVVVRARELGEFASRYAAMVFAERSGLKDDAYSIVRRPLESCPRKQKRRRGIGLRSTETAA
jgi:hypothetical protein